MNTFIPIVQIVLQIIQIITVPITMGITFFNFKKLMQSHEVSKNLSKAKYSNEFVLNFKKIYSDLRSIIYIKSFYYEKVKLIELKKYIHNQDVLKFEKDYYLGALKANGLNRKNIQDLISDLGKANNQFIQSVSDCCKVKIFESKSDFWYVEYYDKYEHLLEGVELDKNLSQSEKKNVMEYIDTCFIHTLSSKEADLLNDLECLCMNTKFGLINYNVVYNLIVMLFEFVVRNYYIELMESILTAKEEGYEVYSNIVDAYNQLMKIKIKRIENAEQKKKELDIINSDTQQIFK